MGSDLTHGSAFSGIGGAEVAADLAGGYRHAWAVELADHPAALLAQRYPGLQVERDMTDCRMISRLPRVDVLTAGFPCQPFSVAGVRKGVDDDRNLWPETARLIRHVGPRVCLLENVPALRNPHRGSGQESYFGTVLGDLAALGYSIWWDGVPAASVGAHHRRDRLWIVAFAPGVEPWDCFGAFRNGTAAVGPWWPTPQLHDHSAGNASRDWRYGSLHGGRNLNDSVANALWQTGEVTGVLNPEWIELLMGYPRGWTDLGIEHELATDATPPWRGEDVLSVGDLPGTNPLYRDHWYGLRDVTPLRERDAQTTLRLKALGNAWVPQVAAPILAAIVKGLGG